MSDKIRKVLRKLAGKEAKAEDTYEGALCGYHREHFFLWSKSPASRVKSMAHIVADSDRCAFCKKLALLFQQKFESLSHSDFADNVYYPDVLQEVRVQTYRYLETEIEKAGPKDMKGGRYMYESEEELPVYHYLFAMETKLAWMRELTIAYGYYSIYYANNDFRRFSCEQVRPI